MADQQVAAAVQVMAPIEDAVLLSALQVLLDDRPSVVQELADWMLPDKAYGNARLLQENRQTGKIKSFTEAKGYGFIDCPEVMAAFGSDVFLHRSQIGSYGVGLEVSFAILVNKDRKPQAFDLGPALGGADLKMKGSKGAGACGKAAGGKAAGGKAAGGKAGAGKADAVWGAADAGWGAAVWGADASWGKGAQQWGPSDPWHGPPTSQAWGKGSDPWGIGPPAGCGKGSGGAKGAGGAKGPPAKGKTAYASDSGTPRGPPDTSADMPGVTDQRHEGVVKSFNFTKGFGFITCDALHEQFGADTFVHKMQMEGFEVGQEVSFDVFLNKDGKPQAKELAPAGGAPAAKRMKFI